MNSDARTFAPRPAPTVPPRSAVVLDLWVDLANEVLDAKYAWIAETNWEPTPDSPLAIERDLLLRQYGPGGDWDSSDSQNVLGVGSMFLELAGQHFEGLAALMTARQAIVPVAPVARSLLEACARVAWVLEPLPYQPHRKAFVNVRQRAARVTAVRLEDLTRAKTVAVSLSHTTAQRRVTAVKELRQEIIPARFWPSEIEDKDGKLTIRGQKLPGFRESAVHFARVHGVDWKAGGLYDYLANASHPTPTTILEITVPGELGNRRFEIADPTYPCRLMRMSAIALLHTWAMLAQYLGRAAWSLDSLYQRIDALPDA